MANWQLRVRLIMMTIEKRAALARSSLVKLGCDLQVAKAAAAAAWTIQSLGGLPARPLATIVGLA